jgi:hypothetical protein
MVMRSVPIDQEEEDYAKQLFDSFVTIWNSREKRGERGEDGPLPISIYNRSFRERFFTDCATGRIYQIILRRAQFWFEDRSWCYQHLRRDNIKEVRRIVSGYVPLITVSGHA